MSRNPKTRGTPRSDFVVRAAPNLDWSAELRECLDFAHIRYDGLDLQAWAIHFDLAASAFLLAYENQKRSASGEWRDWATRIGKLASDLKADLFSANDPVARGIGPSEDYRADPGHRAHDAAMELDRRRPEGGGDWCGGQMRLLLETLERLEKDAAAVEVYRRSMARPGNRKGDEAGATLAKALSRMLDLMYSQPSVERPPLKAKDLFVGAAASAMWKRSEFSAVLDDEARLILKHLAQIKRPVTRKA